MRSHLVSCFLACIALAAAAVLSPGCASAPPGSIPTANAGAAGTGGGAEGRSGTMTPNTAMALGPASDATALEFGWTRQATTPVAGDVYQLVAGDASFLPPDAVENAYTARVNSALAAAAAPNAPPEAAAAADAAIAQLRTYHEARMDRVVSTGRAGPQIMVFVGTKVTHGTTSADTPAADVVDKLGTLAGKIGEVTGAAKGAAPPAK